MTIKMLFVLVLLQLYAGCIAEDYEIDPKEEFFRNVHLYDSSLSYSENLDQNLPKSDGLYKENDDNDNNVDRSKRSYHILPSRGLKSHFALNLKNEQNTKQRIKRESSTSTTEKISNTTLLPERKSTTDNKVVINDFIRFKRDDANVAHVKDVEEIMRLKREPEIETGKMIMDPPSSERETRGITKEQWIKQPYPVERTIDDNIPSASDNIRAPRVHFVTQRRQGLVPESRDVPQQRVATPAQPPPLPRPAHRSLEEREGRSRDFDPFIRNLPHSYHYPYPRPRSYEPYYPRHYDPHFEQFDRRPAFDEYELNKYNRANRPFQNLPPPPPPPLPLPSGQNKQRRIIYYATLPEVVRTPFNSESRYRYRYQDGYDNRYLTPVDPYRIRKPYSNHQLQKQKEFDRGTIERKKTPLYPVKVSTDVNVRETKKNPERKIFSEADSRYVYKAPSFQTVDDDNY